MIDLRHVLAATDFSPPSRHAAERAAMVAVETGAALDLVHVFDLPGLEKLRRLVAQTSSQIEERMLAHARAEAERHAELLHERRGVRPAVHVLTGTLLAELRAQAQALGADLVVLGARGESFMRHALLGSTAVRLLSTMQAPMLVVKQVPRDRYRTLLVPVDFSAASLPAIAFARALAPSAEIVLVNAFEVPFEGQLRFANVNDDVIWQYRAEARREAIARMHLLRDAAGLEPTATRILVLHGDASSRIVEQEQEIDCDLIVMGRHGESTLEHFLIGSVTRHVLAEAQGDVLVTV